MNSYTVFDFETTGLSPQRDRIIQVGICVVENGGVAHKEGWLVNQPVPISAEAERIHGITQGVIEAHGIPPEESLPRLLAHLEKAHLCVGHNIHRFDVPFLEAEARRLKLRIPFVADYVDTAALYKGWKLGVSRGRRVLSMRVRGLKFAIPVCLHQLGIADDHVVAHEAESDAYSTHLIYQRLLTVLGGRI